MACLLVYNTRVYKSAHLYLFYDRLRTLEALNKIAFRDSAMQSYKKMFYLKKIPIL